MFRCAVDDYLARMLERGDGCLLPGDFRQGRCSACNFHRSEYIFVKQHTHIDYVLDLCFYFYAIFEEWRPVGVIVARYYQLTSVKIEWLCGRGRNPSLKTDPSHLTFFLSHEVDKEIPVARCGRRLFHRHGNCAHYV